MTYKIEYVTYNNFVRYAFAKDIDDAIRISEGLKKLSHVTEVYEPKLMENLTTGYYCDKVDIRGKI